MSEQNMYDAIKPEKEVIKTKGVKKDRSNLIIGIVAAVVILLVAAIMCYYFIFMNKEVLATFDGGEVTRGEYELYYRTFAPMLYYYGYDSELIATYIAEKIILDEIILEEATNAGITLTDEGKEEVDTLFEDENNIAEFASRGIDVEALRQVFYNDSVISDYLVKLQEEATVESVKTYIIEKEGEDADFNIYNTRHILFSTASATTDEAKAEIKKEAESVLARVKKGEDFAKLAAEFSDDTYTEQYSEGKYEATTSSTIGGYMDAVKKLTAGKYTTSLVEVEGYGYFIIKLESVAKDGRLTNETEIGYYVDDMLYAKQDAANCEYKKERISAIGTSIGTELGLITAETEVDTDVDVDVDTATE